MVKVNKDPKKPTKAEIKAEKAAEEKRAKEIAKVQAEKVAKAKAKVEENARILKELKEKKENDKKEKAEKIVEMKKNNIKVQKEKAKAVEDAMSPREKELRDEYVGKKVGADIIINVVDKKINKINYLSVSTNKGTIFLTSKKDLDNEIIIEDN